MGHKVRLEVERRHHAAHHSCRRDSRTRVILIGLLMIGPCCALFSARRVSTAQAGVMAVGLALLLAVPDGIWGTVAQFAITGAVLMVAVACTWAAGIMESVTRH